MPKASTRSTATGPQAADEFVDLARDRLRPGRGDAPVLLEPGAVALDLRQGVEVAQDAQDLLEPLVLAALDLLGERLVDLALGVSASGR